jgi:hypothetical protein
MFFKKHKETILLGVLILTVFICAILVLRSPWLETVHSKYIDNFLNIDSSIGNPNIQSSLADIRYPNGEDYIQLSFNESISDYTLEFKSVATGRVYSAMAKDMSDSNRSAKIYIDPGEYIMTLKPKTPTANSQTFSDRVIINPIFNFKGSGNQYYRLPVTDASSPWDNSANMLMGITEYKDTIPRPSTGSYTYSLNPADELDMGSIAMRQFNHVKFAVRLPSIADYKGKLLEIGFASDVEEQDYRKKITQLDSYYPVEFISSVELIGKTSSSDSSLLLPADKKSFSAPKLLFDKNILSSPTPLITVKNVRKDHVYKLSLQLKYRRPESTGYRTSLPLNIRFKVIDTTGNYDLTINMSNANSISKQIIANAKLQLKFEGEQVQQDNRLAQLESDQNRLFEVVGASGAAI